MRGSFRDICCWPECEAAPSGRASLPLCDRHMLRVYREVEGIVKGASMETRLRAVDVIAADGKAARSKPGFVYFIQFSDRVKIGFTEDVARRLRELPYDRVLAVTPGSLTQERRFHKQFRQMHVRGEWFRAEPELIAFTATLQSVEGDLTNSAVH